MTRFKGIKTQYNIADASFFKRIQYIWPDLRGLRPALNSAEPEFSVIQYIWPDLRGLRQIARPKPALPALARFNTYDPI